MADKLAIINRAASATGNERLASLDDTGEVALVLNEHYEAIVADLLTQPGWKFAKRTAALTRLTDVAVAPWAAIFALPPDLLALSLVQSAQGLRLDHEQCSAASGPAVAVLEDWSTLQVIARYVARVPEAEWPGDFTMAVQLRMEAIMLSAIAEQRTAAGAREGAANSREQRARVRDANSSTPGDPAEWDLTRSRDRVGAWGRFRERGGRAWCGGQPAAPVVLSTSTTPTS